MVALAYDQFALASAFRKTDTNTCPSLVREAIFEGIRSRRGRNEEVIFLIEVYWRVLDYRVDTPEAGVEKLPSSQELMASLFWELPRASLMQLKVFEMLNCKVSVGQVLLMVLSADPQSRAEKDVYMTMIQNVCDRLHLGFDHDSLLDSLVGRQNNLALYDYAIERIALSRIKHTDKRVLLKEAMLRVQERADLIPVSLA